MIIKILTLGDSGCGKSSLLNRYTEDDFNEEFITTIGMDFKFKRVFVKGHEVKVQIWDTAGQERFRTITKTYCRNAQGLIFVYDVTSRDSEKNVFKWWKDVTEKGPDYEAIIVGNKIDLVDECERGKVMQRAKDLAQSIGIRWYFLTSAKTDENVDR